MRGNGFIAFLLGAIAGGVAALLLAPSSGEETRKKLNKTANQLRGELSDEYEKRKKDLEDLTDQAKNVFTKTNNDLSNAAKEAASKSKGTS